MSLYDDPSWNREARHVAEKLDRNDVMGAQESMRRDLFQLQDDPRAQHQFINLVNQYDHKHMGADLNILRGPGGQEQWQIMPYNYDARNYPMPLPAPEQMPPVVIVPERPPVVVVPPRETPGERVVDGLATGVGVGLGMGIMHKIFHNGRH